MYRLRLVIAVLCRICECVKSAVIKAEINVLVVCPPFPNPKGTDNYRRYVEGFVETLQLLMRGALLEDMNYCSNKTASKG